MKILKRFIGSFVGLTPYIAVILMAVEAWSIIPATHNYASLCREIAGYEEKAKAGGYYIPDGKGGTAWIEGWTPALIEKYESAKEERVAFVESSQIAKFYSERFQMIGAIRITLVEVLLLVLGILPFMWGIQKVIRHRKAEILRKQKMRLWRKRHKERIKQEGREMMQNLFIDLPSKP